MRTGCDDFAFITLSFHHVTSTAASEPTLNLSVADSAPAGWDAFVRATPTATHAHLAGWQHVFDGVLGHRTRYAILEHSDGSVAGVLPIVDVRSRIFGRYLMSMPFLNAGGPIGGAAAQRQLAAWAQREAVAANSKLLELRWTADIAAVPRTVGGDFPRPASLPETLAVSDRKITVAMPLPETATELFEKGLKSKLRSQVRRPMKEGLTARFGADQCAPFYDVFARNMRELGTPVLPRKFFEALLTSFPNEVVFATVWRGDTLMAGGCGFLYANSFEITWASSLREFNQLSPNMLLYWAMMEHVIGAGARRFDFGRCTPGSSTHRFKTQWGAVDERLPWASWSSTPDSGVPKQDSGAFALASRVWTRLPLSVTNALGPFLAKSIP